MREGRPGKELAAQISNALGINLRRQRTRRGLSLERLARISGVSRAMLGQIETGKSSPTIGVLWKIAEALRIPLASLVELPQARSVVVVRRMLSGSAEDSAPRFMRRAIFPSRPGWPSPVEEIRLGVAHREACTAGDGTAAAQIIVAQGVIEFSIAETAAATLRQGDAIAFETDTAFVLTNLGDDEALLYLSATLGPF